MNATSTWRRSFIEAMEGLGLGRALTRGRRPAKAGDVSSLEIRAGIASGEVRDGDEHYTADFLLRTWDSGEVALIARAGAKVPGMLGTMMAGRIPENLDVLLAELDLPLFPPSLSDVNFGCTCPYDEDPCPHAATLVYAVAEQIAADPRILLELHGTNVAQIASAGIPQPGGDADREATPAEHLAGMVPELDTSLLVSGLELLNPDLVESGKRPITYWLQPFYDELRKNAASSD